MSHQYVDKTELKTFLGMSGSGQDNNLDFALDAASAAIDDFCGRVFYATSSTEDRHYDCEFTDFAYVDDIATTTGLVVKTLNVDGTDHETLRTMTLKPGEFAWFPWDYTGDIWVESAQNSPILEVWRWDRA